MAHPAYGHGFYAIFVRELEKCRRPLYPTVFWWRCLRQADYEAQVETVRRAALTNYRLTGIQHRHCPESLPMAARSREARQLDAHCSAFLASRGIPSGDYHAY